MIDERRHEISQRFSGHVALITGGARGLGRSLALGFAAEGADIVVSDLCDDIPTIGYPLARTPDLDRVRADVEGMGRRCVATAADVRDQSALDGVVRVAVQTFGRIDIVCANAGVVSHGRVWEMTEDAWRAQIDVNLTGVWHTIKAVAPQLVAQRSGSIIVIASSAAREPGVRIAAYVAAKHGVIGLMKSTALELGAYNIRANAVSPWSMMTDMICNQTVRQIIAGPDATTEDLAEFIRPSVILPDRSALPTSAVVDAVMWLASDKGANVTGVELPVDAGHSLVGIDRRRVERDAMLG
jgi:SDR family mycofactocin-dependent oxidoreductase